MPANHLLRAVVYPDSTLSAQDVIDILNEDPGAPSGRDFVQYTYHANGARATMTDQRAVVRAYTYDAWNRLTLDHATDLGDPGEGVDGFVRGIGTAYDQLGRTAAITSYGDSNDNGILDVVRNQVQYGYDDYDAQANPAGWGGVARVWQEHAGEVNTGTSASVQYAYDSLGRLTSMTHPSGFEVAYDYGAAGSINNRLSRVAAVTNAAGTLDYAAYTYLGAGTIVGAARQLPLDGQPDQTLNLTYGTSQNGYGGLDRFGRVADQLWELDAAAADHFSYGYTRAGNRLWRENVVAGNQNPAVPLDELYSYDELSRLIATERGRLVFDDPNPGDVSLTDAVFGQDWDLDGLGNWLGFDDDGAQQTREHNEANEITSITGGWVTPAYDSAGNMTSGPSPLDGTVRVHYAYDSWNRLVAVRADDAGQPGDLVAEYRYDGLNRRIGKTVPAGEAERATDYFYNESWQLLEARTAEGEDESATHYVWDLSYIDAPIARLFDGNADGDFDDAVDAVHHYTFDANQNVTALVGLVETEPDVFEWQVVERYTYTPYGVATAHDPDWSNPAAPTADGPLYAGYHFDAETGLYHVRHRQYDAQLGTFTTRDPIGYAAGDENLYRYVGNDPVGAVDPMGLDWRTADASIKLAERQLEYVRQLMENSSALRSEIDNAVQRYQSLHIAANRDLSTYLSSSWGAWYYGPELGERVYRLPVTIDGAHSNGSYLNQLTSETRRQHHSLGQITENLTVAEHALRSGRNTLAVGVVVIATAGVGSAFVAPIYVYGVAGGALSVAYGAQVHNRLGDDQEWGQALWGGVNDIAGVTNITMGGWGYDPGTGRLHDLSAEQRGDLLGCGLAQVTLWVTGPFAGKAVRSAAASAFPRGISGSIPYPQLSLQPTWFGGHNFGVTPVLSVGWTSVAIPLAAQGGAAAGGLLAPPIVTLMSGRGGDLPARGQPHSSDYKDYGHGKGQIRDYGPDGRATKDFDFGHDHGHGDPHVHDWDWSLPRPRTPGRPLRPGE